MSKPVGGSLHQPPTTDEWTVIDLNTAPPLPQTYQTLAAPSPKAPQKQPPSKYTVICRACCTCLYEEIFRRCCPCLPTTIIEEEEE